jgi:sterol desaturase/sphingolipid hydroxylase (fatty acid hydroxylase superfamily)
VFPRGERLGGVQLVATFAILGMFLGMAAVERCSMHRVVRALPWLGVALGAFVVVPAWLVTLVESPLALADRIGTVPAAIVGFVVADLIGYATHRSRHTMPLLWRWHQLHHSAERVDVCGTPFLHPIDLAIEIAGVAIAAAVLGLSPDAATLVALASWLLSMFQHVHLRTPRALGWILQRPEAHAVHHARGVHAYNYGKLMVWDIVLGTARDPADFPAESAGFWDGASEELAALLAGRDVGDSRKDER